MIRSVKPKIGQFTARQCTMFMDSFNLYLQGRNVFIIPKPTFNKRG